MRQGITHSPRVGPPSDGEARIRQLFLVDGAAARGRPEPLADAVRVEDVARVARHPAQILAGRHGTEADGAGVFGSKARIGLERLGRACELLLIKHLATGGGERAAVR